MAYSRSAPALKRCAALFFLLALMPSFAGCRLVPWGHHVEKGWASWYGNEYQGRSTASGERFDQNAMTAAHKKLPFQTIVRVKNLKNGRTAVLRINDRGPFIHGRIIDVSKQGARELGMVEAGVVPVRVEVLQWGAK
jgi:rare lipoprotein A